MKILCCGSRNWTEWFIIKKTLSRLLASLNRRFIVLHGGAKGADSLSGMMAGMLGLQVEITPADWLTYGRRAGMIRNTQMLERKPDYVIAFWNGQSRGTLDTIQKAVNVYRIPTIIVRG